MSIVANPSFEAPLGPLQTITPQPLYFGGWSPFQGFNAAPRQPTRVAGGGHSGGWGLRIQADSGTGKGNWVLQDFPAADVDPDNGIYLSAWVRPITGNEQLTLGLDYDRGPGTAAGYLTVDLQPAQSLFTAWGTIGVSAPALAHDGAWHHVGMRSFPDGVGELELDGAVVYSTPAQSIPSFSVATIIVGEGAGVFTPFTDDFYWDDVSLDWSPYPSGGWAIGGVASDGNGWTVGEVS